MIYHSSLVRRNNCSMCHIASEYFIVDGNDSSEDEYDCASTKETKPTYDSVEGI